MAILSVFGPKMVNFGDKSVKYVGRKAASSTATGNFNKHLAEQKKILEKVVGKPN